jgi:hypothetical protein
MLSPISPKIRTTIKAVQSTFASSAATRSKQLLISEDLRSAQYCSTLALNRTWQFAADHSKENRRELIKQFSPVWQMSEVVVRRLPADHADRSLQRYCFFAAFVFFAG